MDIETLNRGCGLLEKIAHLKKTLERVDKDKYFVNVGFDYPTGLFTEQEMDDYRAILAEELRKRANARIAELQKEFDNL